MVTDGGMETDLIFHHGVDLPLFAAFPLIDTAEGRSLLTAYYDEYAAIARRAGAGLMLDSATWRASSDWGDRLGYSPADLARVNRDAISMLAELRERYRDDLADVVISGMVGPRGDGYQPGEEPGPDEAAGLAGGAVAVVPELLGEVRGIVVGAGVGVGVAHPCTVPTDRPRGQVLLPLRQVANPQVATRSTPPLSSSHAKYRKRSQ